MEISRIFHKKVLRYYYSNPSILCSFFSLSPKVLDASNYPTQLYTTLHSDSIHKKPYFCDYSSFPNSDSNPIQKKPSLNYSSCGLQSNFHVDSKLLHKKSSFFKSSYGMPSSLHLFNYSWQSLKTLAILKCNIVHTCSVSSSFDGQRLYDRRLFSVSSSDVTMHSDVDTEIGVILDEVGWQRKGRRVNGIGIELAPKGKFNIIEIIKSGEVDMEVKLSSVASELSMESITEIFQVLNCRRVSGLRFFRWLQANNPRLYLSADFCSLIINNCGWLDDYDTMLTLLNEFKLEKICLHESAFWFLPVFRTNQSSLINSVGRLIDLLNEVGGSCRSSGICALIEMFCKLDLFEMAKHVLKITEKKSYYNILVRQRCKKGHLVSDIIREMTEFGFEPSIVTYNYLVGSLCKRDKITEAYSVLQIMQEKGVLPDASTFEIFIHKFCNCGKMDLAKKFLNTMISSKLEPRLGTHTAVLKALFKSEQYGEAHNYVIDASVMYKHSSCKLYSLLADLHRSKGDLMSAQGIIIEMMDKGHKPDFEVYITIVKKLETIGHDHSARDLRNMYSSFLEESSTTTGRGDQ